MALVGRSSNAVSRIGKGIGPIDVRPGSLCAYRSLTSVRGMPLSNHTVTPPGPGNRIWQQYLVGPTFLGAFTSRTRLESVGRKTETILECGFVNCSSLLAIFFHPAQVSCWRTRCCQFGLDGLGPPRSKRDSIKSWFCRDGYASLQHPDGSWVLNQLSNDTLDRMNRLFR